VAFDGSELVWAERRLTDLQPTANLEVRGLRNRYRRPGIGATFAALAAAPDGAELDPVNALIAPRMRLPLAVFLRFEAPRAGLREAAQRATLEIYNSRDDDEVEVAGRRVPLEFETSAALALTLDGAPVWDSEIAGFRNPALLSEGGILRTWGRHRHGRIPLVLVHGTASSPARWAELVNELESDREIRQRFEFWLFTYATGQPILYSASVLRDALRDAVAVLDPDGDDPGLQRMVIAGHSQGGLLCKLQVVASGNRFWDAITKLPFEEIELEPERREILRKALFIEPLPFVDRVIFISTPQRGSFLAGNWMGRIASSLTSAPQNLVGVGIDMARAGIALPGAAVDLAREGVDTLQGDEQGKVLRQMAKMPSSVDNMNPRHRFIHTLSSIPVEPPVVAHSIIPVTGAAPPDGQNDGVVEYSSAHIEEAESELVVFHASHSVQGHPEAIQEVRRILLEHLATP
jgi:triacylglycerol esterase/lipase EstA (alpha/beta hydrolase family)